MKTNLHPRAGVQASVLIIALIVGAILLTTLLSYLSLLNNQNLSVARSQAWNNALVLAESGVEEALAQLNAGAGRTNPLSGTAWTLSGGYYSPKVGERSMLGGKYSVKYSSTAPPVIYATGSADVPTKSSVVKRAVEVQTIRAPLFYIGVVAKSNINLNGNALFSNSFNSASPTNSNNGQYDPSKALNGGDVASVYGKVDAGNRDIYGTVFLGPGGSFQGSGTISGGIVKDFNMDFPDVLPPYTGGSQPGPINLGSGKNYNWELQSGGIYYYDGNVSGKTIYVSGANAMLYITGNASFPTIDFATNASVSIYVGGANTTFGDVNNYGIAKQLQYYGLPGNTSVTLNGNNAFVGTLYAPNADLALNGGGSDGADIRGAVMVKKITSNGKFQIHFDEDLKTNGPPRGYVAISWKEISP